MNMLPSKIHDHNNDLDYMLVGDYYFPDFKPFEVPPLGKYGRMRLRYLKEHRPCTYTVLLLSGKLYYDLHDADETAQRMLDQLIPQMAKDADVTEEMKTSDPMRWIGMMNSMIFVKEYFRRFALLSFYSKKYSLYIFITLISLTTASNPPIIPYGVSLKLHSVAKSIMPLRMGSRVRIPHRTAAVLAERLSQPFGVSHWGESSGKARASAGKPESEYILFAAIKGLPGLGRAVFSVPKYPVSPDVGGFVWRAQSTVPTEKDCRCSAFCRLTHQTKGGTTE